MTLRPHRPSPTLRLALAAAAALGAAALGGCAMFRGDPGESPSLHVSGDGDVVKVTTPWPGLDTRPAAERRCRQYGRTAKLREESLRHAIYDCIEPVPAG